MQGATWSSIRPYGVAMLAVVSATVIRQLLDPWLASGQIFSWYYMALAIAAWCGGWRCSLLACVMGFAAADWFFIQPRGSFISFSSELGNWLGLASYSGVCLAIASCTEAIRRQTPALVFRLDLDDSVELLDVALAVRRHGIRPEELPAYLDGLNVSQGVYRLAIHFSLHHPSSRELAARLESFAKRSGASEAFSF